METTVLLSSVINPAQVPSVASTHTKYGTLPVQYSNCKSDRMK